MLRTPRRFSSCALLAALALTTAPGAVQAAQPAEAVETTARIGEAVYADSLTTAKALKTAVEALTASPSAETLQAARQAWLAARVPYQQSEAFRFGNPLVDEWEGKVNAWPLDEGLLDYVAPQEGAADENAFALANVVANPTFTLSGETVDATTIDADLLRALHEIGGIEANVSTGYHAVEFLLWGQDLNGVGPGAGDRPATDFDPANCTGGACDRRAAYLTAATDLLIADLEEMAASWAEGGEARKALTADPQQGLTMAFTGLGSLSYGELAGERMKLGLMLHDPEEEHDCFSDNTHHSHFYDALGIRNVYLGRYVRTDGTVVEGPSLSDLVAAAAPETDAALKADLDATQAAMQAIVDKAEAGPESKKAYDQMLAPGDAEGEALIMAAVNALVAQTRNIERAVAALDLSAIELEGSDSLDDPDAVFQ